MLPKNESEAIRLLQDPEWRIRNLYWIMDKSGRKIPFVPNSAQVALLSTIWHRNIILKARQMGFSTLIQLLMLDQTVFNEDIRAGVIAQDKDSASVIFRDKIKFAWDNLPPMIHEQLHTVSDSTSELLFSNNSGIRVATSLRSGTLQFLHVSEFGKICARTPDKAREVLTGSLPTVAADGFTFIESTAEGREGAFFDMCQASQKHQDERRPYSQLDFKFHFFPWFTAPEYTLDSIEPITDADAAYFEAVEAKAGAKLTDGQKRWYVSKRRTDFSGDPQMMKQEYPSLPEEAFEQSVEGCYYTAQMNAVRKSGRIGSVPYLPGYPVNTFWDIGNSDGTAIWFHQRVGQENRFIRFYENWGESYSHFVQKMQEFGYVWGAHYLPHDATHKRQGTYDNESPMEKLENLGLKNIETVERVPEIMRGINEVRDIFPTVSFDATNCVEGIKHLDSYAKQWDDRRGRWSDTPRHDIHSEAADAFRQFAQGYKPFTSAPARTYVSQNASMRSKAF